MTGIGCHRSNGSWLERTSLWPAHRRDVLASRTASRTDNKVTER